MWRAARASGWPRDAHGMMRYVFVEVCENQQKLEHAVPLLWIRLLRAFFETLDDGQRIGKKPFEASGIHR